MKNPHDLSAPFILDPGYSASVRTPNGAGSSLYADSPGIGQPWLYLPGDLEAFLMARARERAFRCCHRIAHPGYFRPPHRSVYFRTDLVIEENTSPRWMAFECAGAMRLMINKRVLGWWPASARPREVAVDVSPYLRVGSNHFVIMLFGAEEPSCLRPDPGLSGWVCGGDYQRWEEPQELPFVGRELFPHQEELPYFTIAALGREGPTYDFGVEVIGRLRLDRMDAGASYRFRPGESEAEVRSTDQEWAEQSDIVVDAQYKSSPETDERAIRFVRLEEGACPAPRCEDLRCDVAVHPAAYRGAFACADPAATQLWMHSAYTLRMCMRDVTVDGLKRDRVPWVGDLYLSQIGNAYVFAEHRLFLRTLLSFYHPHPDGADFSGIFDFTLFWVFAAGNYLLYSGDLRGARLLWPRVKIVLEAMARRLSPEGFLLSDHAQWVFIDWTDLPKKGILLVIQALYIQALEGAALLGRTLGAGSEARRLEAQAAQLRSRVDERFWDPGRNCYSDAFLDGALTPDGSRHANAFAVLSGVASGARAAEALQAARLNPAARIAATPYMRYFENAAYCRAGLAELMFSEVANYWGGMLKEGATTLWEAYDFNKTGDERYAFYGRPFGNSLCHAWASGPLPLYSSELFGLKPVEAGWKSFTFSPLVVSLPWAAVCVPTPAGMIRAEFEGDTAQVEVPRGCAIVNSSSTLRVAAPDDRSKTFAFRRDGAIWLPC